MYMNFKDSIVIYQSLLSATTVITTLIIIIFLVNIISWEKMETQSESFWFQNIFRVLNVVWFLLGNSPASEFRRQGITQKKAYNNQTVHQPLIDLSKAYDWVKMEVLNNAVIEFGIRMKRVGLIKILYTSWLQRASIIFNTLITN